jgi:hypothetical protein
LLIRSLFVIFNIFFPRVICNSSCLIFKISHLVKFFFWIAFQNFLFFIWFLDYINVVIFFILLVCLFFFLLRKKGKAFLSIFLGLLTIFRQYFFVWGIWEKSKFSLFRVKTYWDQSVMIFSKVARSSSISRLVAWIFWVFLGALTHYFWQIFSFWIFGFYNVINEFTLFWLFRQRKSFFPRFWS